MDGSLAPLSAPPSPETDAVQIVARVTAVEDGLVTLVHGRRRLRARRATSCVVEPAPGDAVVALEAATGAFVVAILDRPSDAAAVISVPGTDAATLCQNRLSLRCANLSIDAGIATLRGRIARIATRTLVVVADRLDVVARTLRRSADHDFSHAKVATRTVETAQTLKAGEIMIEAGSALAQRAGIVLVDAREDVRVNGERITMG